MNATTTKKGAAGKFLALTASVTMIAAGIVGVALAAPASADVAWTKTMLNQTGTDISATGTNDDCEPVPSDRDGWHFIITAEQWGQTNFAFSAGSDAVVVSADASTPGQKKAYHLYVSTTVGATLDGSSTWANLYSSDGPTGEFTLSHTCKGTPPQPETTSLTVTKAWEGTNGAASNTLATTLNSTDPATTAGPLTVTVGGKPSNQTWGATKTGLPIGTTVVVSEGTVPDLKSADFPPGYTCSVVTVDYPKFSQNDFKLGADANTVTVTNGVSCSLIPVTPPPPVTPPSTPETPTAPETPVVTPPAAEVTAVSVPLEATVAAPAAKPVKKPAKVTLPASVPAGVVSIPSKATLPGAVPAGDGSQAPGLPMWAMALMVVGALGAAGAGKQILAARK